MCVLVFLFAFHAKTALYNGGQPVKATPSTSSKLWVNGQKMELPPIVSNPILPFCVALLFMYQLVLRPVVLSPTLEDSPSPRRLRLWELHRFLRPPPFLA
jgi:hypothetical protein